MGNYASSCAFVPPKLRNPKSAKVILPCGEIRQFRHPVKAADLMLDAPNFFLVNSKSLAIGRRFSPLPADEDLEFGNLYVMFPIRRARSAVTAADITVFLVASSSAHKRISGSGSSSVRISPVAAAAEKTTPSSHDDDESSKTGRTGLSLEGLAPEFQCRLSVYQSKRPGLDTILEEPLFSR